MNTANLPDDKEIHNRLMQQSAQDVTVPLSVSQWRAIDYLCADAMLTREEYVLDAVNAALKRANTPSPFREDWGDWEANDQFADYHYRNG